MASQSIIKILIVGKRLVAKFIKNLCSLIDNDTPSLGSSSNNGMNINNEWRHLNVPLCIHESKGEFEIIEKLIMKTTYIIHHCTRS
jgi:hypothetical protein